MTADAGLAARLRELSETMVLPEDAETCRLAAAALTRPLPEECPRMECPRCKGTGKVQVSTFADPSKQRDSSCHVCKGRGTLTPDLEAQNAHLVEQRNAALSEVSALKHDIAVAESDLLKTTTALEKELKRNWSDQ